MTGSLYEPETLEQKLDRLFRYALEGTKLKSYTVMIEVSDFVDVEADSKPEATEKALEVFFRGACCFRATATVVSESEAE